MKIEEKLENKQQKKYIANGEETCTLTGWGSFLEDQRFHSISF